MINMWRCGEFDEDFGLGADGTCLHSEIYDNESQLVGERAGNEIFAAEVDGNVVNYYLEEEIERVMINDELIKSSIMNR